MSSSYRSVRKKEQKTARAVLRLEKQRRRLTETFDPQPLEGWQADVRAAIAVKDFIVLSGPPGTGKTYLATRLAVEQYKRGRVGKIYVVRPAVEAGEHLGFLPGTVLEKMGPYLAPIFECLRDMGLSGEDMLREGSMEIIPIAFAKGRTLNGIVILDEAQDCTNRQLRLVISRLGFRGQMIITGDSAQSDCVERPNPFKVFCDKLALGDRQGYELVKLSDSDIRRHALIAKLLTYTRNED